jgi:hypothetical protein
MVFAETWAYPVPPALKLCGLFMRRSVDGGRTFGPLACAAGLDEPNTPGNVPNYVGNVVPLLDSGFGRPPAALFLYTHANNFPMMKHSADLGKTFGPTPARAVESFRLDPLSCIWSITDDFSGPFLGRNSK